MKRNEFLYCYGDEPSEPTKVDSQPQETSPRYGSGQHDQNWKGQGRHC